VTNARLARQMGASLLGTIGFRLCGAVGGILSARLLGPAEKGQYSLLILVGTAFGMLGTAGLQFWVAIRVAGPQEGEGVQAMIRRQVFVAGAILAAVTAVGGALAGVTHVASLGEILSVGLLAFGTTWSMLELAVPNGRMRMGAVAGITTLSGLTFLGWMAVMDSLGWKSVAVVLLGAAVSNLIMVPLARRHRRTLPSWAGRVPPATYRAALRFGLPASGGELLTLATFRLDLVLVAAFLSRREVGLYAVALALSELLWVVPDGVAQVLLPHVAGQPGRRDTGRLVVVAGSVMIVGGLLLVLLGRRLITVVFGSDYAGSAVAVAPLAAAAVAIGIWKMIGADVVARGGSRVRAASALTGLGVMVVADCLLIPRIGIVGAGIGSLIGYATAATYVTLAWRSATNPPVLSSEIPVLTVAP
jgi:O-antigen/teichoic acid export membrane protein